MPGDAIRQGPSGPWILAARVKGLFPAGQAPGGTPAAAGSAGRKNGHPLPMAQKSTPAKPAANAGKKTSNGQPAAARAAKPATQAKQPRQAAPANTSTADDFPEELVGGIPRPKKGLNFDKFAIDTTPVKVTGRKSSRVSGMKREEHAKVMRIMVAAIGGALVLSALLITLAVLKSRSDSTTADQAPPTAGSSQPDASKADAAAVASKASESKPAKAAEKPAAAPGKSAPAKASPDAIVAKHPSAAKSSAAKTAKSPPAKAENAAAGKAAGKADPNKPIGPNDKGIPDLGLPPDN
jgi:hypothetical protein